MINNNLFSDVNPNNINQGIFNVPNMNPNFGIMNQIQLNQMLMNMVALNPNLFANNNPNQNNMAKNQFGNMNNNMNTGAQGRSLPRKQFPYVESYPGYNGPRINVIFEISTGPKLNIAAPVTETVQGLLFKFCERAGVSPILLKKEIICIYNAIFINPNNTQSLQQFFNQNLGLNDQAKIVVIDAKNIIGAK